MKQETVILYFDPNRFKRVQRARVIQHLTAGAVLLITGISAFLEPEIDIWILPAFEIIIGAALILALIGEKKLHLKKHHYLSFTVNLLAGLALVMEGFNRMHEGGRYIQYAYFFLAILTFYVLQYRTDFSLRKHIRLDEKSFFARTGFMKSYRVDWTDISSLDIGENSIVIKPKDSLEITIDLTSALDRAMIIGKIRRFAEHNKIAVEPSNL